MVAAGNYYYCLWRSLIHQAVLLINSAQPEPGQIALQRLWLPDAREGSSRYLVQQAHEPLKPLFIGRGSARELAEGSGRDSQIIHYD